VDRGTNEQVAVHARQLKVSTAILFAEHRDELAGRVTLPQSRTEHSGVVFLFDLAGATSQKQSIDSKTMFVGFEWIAKVVATDGVRHALTDTGLQPDVRP